MWEFPVAGPAEPADWMEHKKPSWPKLVNHYNRQIPVYLWTEAVLHGHTMNQQDGVQWIDGPEEPVTLESDIKMILNLAGQHTHQPAWRYQPYGRDPAG